MLSLNIQDQYTGHMKTVSGLHPVPTEVVSLPRAVDAIAVEVRDATKTIERAIIESNEDAITFNIESDRHLADRLDAMTAQFVQFKWICVTFLTANFLFSVLAYALDKVL